MPKSRKTKEQAEQEIESGEKEENIYKDSGREVMADEDEITDVEEGFMKGYEEDEKSALCQNCKKVLEDEESIVEIDYKGDTYRFCSEDCAEKFTKKKKIE